LDVKKEQVLGKVFVVGVEVWVVEIVLVDLLASEVHIHWRFLEYLEKLQT
jgi:hypothetical protein